MCYTLQIQARARETASRTLRGARRPIRGAWRRLLFLTLLLPLPPHLPVAAFDAGASPGCTAIAATGPSQAAPISWLYLPLIRREPGWTSIPNSSYSSLCMDCVPGWRPTEPPALSHPDVNLGLLGYVPCNRPLAMVDYAGATDPGAPHLTGLFASPRTPVFVGTYQVRRWDWDKGSLDEPIAEPPVTLLKIATTPGEIIHTPQAGREIGGGYQAIVLLAEETRITLKYTREDDVICGYTLHLEGILVDPALLELYRTPDARGRHALPALRSGQAFARASGGELGVAIRDTGRLMDPRSHKDWWPDV